MLQQLWETLLEGRRRVNANAEHPLDALVKTRLTLGYMYIYFMQYNAVNPWTLFGQEEVVVQRKIQDAVEGILEFIAPSQRKSQAIHALGLDAPETLAGILPKPEDRKLFSKWLRETLVSSHEESGSRPASRVI